MRRKWFSLWDEYTRSTLRSNCQALIKLWLPVNKNLSEFAEWRYCGYDEAFYLYEGFRTHLVTAGLRFTP